MGVSSLWIFAKSPLYYPALVLLQYAETKGRRANPQKALHGLTIEDPGDGRISGIMPSLQADGNFKMVDLADLASAGVSTVSVEQRPAALECNPETQSCGGGGGGGSSPPPGPAPPRVLVLKRIQTVNVEDGTPWESNEFEFHAQGPDGRYLTPRPRREGVDKNEIINLNLLLLDRIPSVTYNPIRVPIYETDLVGDDTYFNPSTQASVRLHFDLLPPVNYRLYRDGYEGSYPTSNTIHVTFSW